MNVLQILIPLLNIYNIAMLYSLQAINIYNTFNRNHAPLV